MKFDFFKRKKQTTIDVKKHIDLQSDITRFVIISIPRTGSNLLCGALDAHPEIICHYELFHKVAIYHSSKYGDECVKDYSVKKRNQDPNAFLNHLFEFRFGKHAKTIGYKIFAGHNDSLLDELIQDRKVKKIILKRDNLFLAYVSHLEAQRSGVYVVVKEKENSTKANDFKVTVDLKKFKYFEKINSTFFENIENLLRSSSQEFISLDYNSALSDENRIKLLKFLSVSVNPELLELEYSKQNKRSIEERIANYYEIKRQFSGTKFEKYI
jgi:hypothetical protein